MTRPPKDIAASVRQRLQNVAMSTNRPFQEVLDYYAMERFLYRLARSAHADRFVLKGALMFRVWGDSPTRPTRDIDFLANMDNSVQAVADVFRDLCGLDVEPDGLAFHPDTVRATVIKEDADYPGVRVIFRATLQNARVAMQADLGFADVVTPGPVRVRFPVILEFPAPEISAYTTETVVAEKFEAMVRLGVLNSRMKDFYDLWEISRRFDFDGASLSMAVAKTFENRKMTVPTMPFALSPDFAAADGKEIQWKGFVRKARIEGVPSQLPSVLADLRLFLLPLADELSKDRTLDKRWMAPGPWI